MVSFDDFPEKMSDQNSRDDNKDQKAQILLSDVVIKAESEENHRQTKRTPTSYLAPPIVPGNILWHRRKLMNNLQY
jgi:hypothetical protein